MSLLTRKTGISYIKAQNQGFLFRKNDSDYRKFPLKTTCQELFERGSRYFPLRKKQQYGSSHRGRKLKKPEIHC